MMTAAVHSPASSCSSSRSSSPSSEFELLWDTAKPGTVPHTKEPAQCELLQSAYMSIFPASEERCAFCLQFGCPATDSMQALMEQRPLLYAELLRQALYIRGEYTVDARRALMCVCARALKRYEEAETRPSGYAQLPFTSPAKTTRTLDRCRATSLSKEADDVWCGLPFANADLNSLAQGALYVMP